MVFAYVSVKGWIVDLMYKASLIVLMRFKNLLMAPKDQDPIQKRSGVIYRYKSDRVECDKEYIGESQELLGRGSRNIQRPLLQYLTITTSLLTMLLLRISALWEGGPEPHENYQRSFVHKGQQSIL